LLALIATIAFGRLLISYKVREFLPAFLRHSQSATVSKNQANAEIAPAANSASETAAIKFLPAPSPVAASRATASGKVATPKFASSTNSTRAAANLADPLAPPERFASQDGVGDRTNSATRAISGSDGIVAAALQPMKQIIAPGPVTVPASTVPLPASTAPTQLPPSGSGTTVAPAAAVTPPVGSDKDLLARAQTGDPAAQFALAALYAEDPSTKENLAQAAQWYEKAAAQGHAVAEYRLASLYEKGHGVAKDIERAKALYQRAAETGNIPAMHNLGVLAAEGSDGKPNYTSAALWFSKAARYGVKDSQYNFAVLLARGLGVTKDLVRSYTWFAIVAATGDADAARKRDEVAARLTSSELSAAKVGRCRLCAGNPGQRCK
jgi:localization factor PodJL